MNQFELHLDKMVGKTIEESRLQPDGSVLLVFTDETMLVIEVDEDYDLSIQEVVLQDIDLETSPPSTLDDKFSVGYSPRRHELYIFDRKDSMQFSIMDEQLPADVRHMTNDERFSWVLNHYYEELEGFDLV